MSRMRISPRSLLVTVGIAAFTIAWLSAAFEAVRHTPDAY